MKKIKGKNFFKKENVPRLYLLRLHFYWILFSFFPLFFPPLGRDVKKYFSTDHLEQLLKTYSFISAQEG